MNNFTRRLVFLLLAVTVIGCSKKLDTAKVQTAFASSGAVEKGLLDDGLKAISQTNYPAALQSFEKLTYRPNLTKEQRLSVQELVAQLKEKSP